MGNVDSLVIWVGSLDGSQEWLAPPWRTGTMFLICHLLSECKNLRQLRAGNSWSEWPEARSSLTPCPWRGGSCLHVPLAPFQRHIRPPRLFSGLVTDLSLCGCWHTKPPFKKRKEKYDRMNKKSNRNDLDFVFSLLVDKDNKKPLFKTIYSGLKVRLIHW